METLKKEVVNAESAMIEKKNGYKAEWERTQSEKAELAVKLREEQTAIQSLKLKWEASEKEAEHQRLCVKHSQLSQTLMKQNIASFKTAKISASDDDWLLAQQKEMKACLDSMLKSATEETERVRREEENCQKLVKETILKVS